MHIDKELVRKRFSKAAATYSENAPVQKSAAAELVRILSSLSERKYGRVLEIGCGTGDLTEVFLSVYLPEYLWLNDLCPDMEPYAVGASGAGDESSPLYGHVSFIPGDAEKTDFPDNLDLIISGSTFQWLEDIRSFASKCAAALKKDGILAFSSFGENNLREIKYMTGMSLDYYPAADIAEILSDEFDILSASEKMEIVKFDDPMKVLQHLKATGVNGIPAVCSTGGEGTANTGVLMHDLRSKSGISEFVLKYAGKYSVPGGVCLTYHPLWIIAAKK